SRKKESCGVLACIAAPLDSVCWLTAGDRALGESVSDAVK
ncbi:unnamed protein product, partial [Callosobruchus maculatus]